MTARYAVYYAPEQGSRLWEKASAWLGRDAYTGKAVHRPTIPGLEGLDLDSLTSDPRGYGFHATLKAPFELASTAREEGLLDFAAEFASSRRPFSAEIEPSRIGLFHALRMASPSSDMTNLHTSCVREFDRFRAPLNGDDLARRRRAKLTEDQDRKLVDWGYPYIFDEFRFHMTLTGSIRDDVISARIGASLLDYFGEDSGPHLFDGIGIFRQPDRDSPFDIIARLTFGQT